MVVVVVVVVVTTPSKHLSAVTTTSSTLSFLPPFSPYFLPSCLPSFFPSFRLLSFRSFFFYISGFRTSFLPSVRPSILPSFHPHSSPFLESLWSPHAAQHWQLRIWTNFERQSGITRTWSLSCAGEGGSILICSTSGNRNLNCRSMRWIQDERPVEIRMP
jgi:hypothetical protein